MKRLPNLLQLAIDNRQHPNTIRLDGGQDAEATVYVHGVIGSFWGDISAEAFDLALRRISSPVIHLRINSPGGDVFEARAMMTAIAQHKSKVIAHIDGLAASAATNLVMAADEVEISKGARFMIHNAWKVTMGDKRDHEAVRALLDAIDVEIADDYQRRTQQDRQQIVDWMDAETWFSAQQTVDHGFADRVVEVVKAATSENRWNLAAYKNAPKDLTDPAPPPPRTYDLAAMHRRLALLERSAA